RHACRHRSSQLSCCHGVRARPESYGMEDRHDQSAIDLPVTLDHATRQSANDLVRRTVERLIGEGREIGVQVAAYLDGELVIDVAAGIADPASGRPVDPDTLFHVFSVT